jgi:tellurium resistance protein TerZ
MSMAIDLAKGQVIDLTKKHGLKRLEFGLGWQKKEATKHSGFFGALKSAFANSSDVDLDASVLLMNNRGEVLDVVYFGSMKSKCSSILHSGDDRSGGGPGDNEVIKVDLEKIPSHITRLALTVNSFTGEKFSQLNSAYGRITDNNQSEAARYTLTEMGPYTALIIGLAFYESGGWKFKVVGELCDGRTVEQLKEVCRNVAMSV